MRRMAKMRSENGWVVMMITMIIRRPADVSHWKALFWLVLVPLFSCCAFFLRLNQGQPPLSVVLLLLVLVLVLVLVLLLLLLLVLLLVLVPVVVLLLVPVVLLLLLLLLLLLRRLLLLLLLLLLPLQLLPLLLQVLPLLPLLLLVLLRLTPTPLLLWSFLPSSRSTALVVPELMTLPTELPSSTGTRHRTHTVLNDQYSLGMRSTGCSSTRLLLKLLIYGSVFVSSSFRVPPSVQTSLGAISLRFHPVSFHAAVCCQARGSYIVPGATLLGAVLIWYTVYRLLQQTLLHKPLPFYGFVFVFLSSSSYYSSYSSSSSSSSSFFFFFFFFSSSSFFFSLLLSHGLPPRMHIKLPWGHLSMASGLAEGNEIITMMILTMIKNNNSNNNCDNCNKNKT